MKHDIPNEIMRRFDAHLESKKTLRDEFAMVALRSINIREHTTTQSADTIALTAYLIADAMMEERNR